MYHLLKTSIAYHKARPFLQPRDIAHYSLKDTVNAMVKNEKNMGRKQPEHEALKFYLLNDAFSKVCAKFDFDEPLLLEMNGLLNRYVSEANQIGLRLFYYCLLILTREARHMPHNQYLTYGLAVDSGQAFADFAKKIVNVNETAAVDKLRLSPPDVTLGEYVQGMCNVFYKGGWSGHSYGGPKWGAIADSLLRVVKGEVSMETFVDTGFALCHNGGPIFNKGMLYETYGPEIHKILDVQRSGQIPQLIGEYHDISSDAVRALLAECRDVLGADFGSGHVDWFAAEAWAVDGHEYPEEKAAQIKKYGASSISSEKVKKKAEEEASKFYVMPDVYATIVEREKVAA